MYAAVFPERVLVYHAGTGRTVFLGCLKVTTIFIFVFFTFVVAPTHLKAEDEPLWVAPAGTLCTSPSNPLPLLRVFETALVVLG